MENTEFVLHSSNGEMVKVNPIFIERVEICPKDFENIKELRELSGRALMSEMTFEVFDSRRYNTVNALVSIKYKHNLIPFQSYGLPTIIYENVLALLSNDKYHAKVLDFLNFVGNYIFSVLTTGQSNCELKPIDNIIFTPQNVGVLLGYLEKIKAKIDIAK